MKLLKLPLHLLRRYWAELFALAGLAALIIGVKPPELAHAFRSIDWRIALLMAPVVLLVYLARGTAWWYALRAIGEHIGFVRTQLIETAGQVMIILPLGDLARVAMVRNTDQEHGVGALTATVALQELLFMLFVSLGALPRLAQHPDFALVMILTMLAFISIFVVLLWDPAYERALRLVEHVKFLRRFDQQLHEIRPAFVQLCKPRVVWRIALFQAIAAILSFFLFYLAMRAIGITTVGYISAVFVLGVAYTFAAVSFLPLGIGAFEGLITVILLTLNIPAATGAAAGLIFRGYNDVLMALLGGPALLYVRSRQRVQRGQREVHAATADRMPAAAGAPD
ncbi:MAG: YbhN family protein [Candidatus Dormibacteria bacterium]